MNAFVHIGVPSQPHIPTTRNQHKPTMNASSLILNLKVDSTMYSIKVSPKSIWQCSLELLENLKQPKKWKEKFLKCPYHSHPLTKS